SATAVNAVPGNVPHAQQSFGTSLQSASLVHALYLSRSSTSHCPALQNESIVPGGGSQGGQASALEQSKPLYVLTDVWAMPIFESTVGWMSHRRQQVRLAA